MHDRTSILRFVTETESRLKETEQKRENLTAYLNELRLKLSQLDNPSSDQKAAYINARFTPQQKIALFRSLFRGREDVYPRLWIGKNGNKGYSPVCENEWKPGLCRKAEVKCGECEQRRFSPVSDDVIRRHLDGAITIGVYPMLQDETCWILAIDFDEESWQDDALAFMAVCKGNEIPTSLERSRSGNGGHVWIFFSEPVPASLARQMVTSLITRTMEERHELDMKSYDRLFPNQDTMPKG